ncbi:hypothetical protein L6452_20201 [Arctium lappa]|uniref:Uncharacterized protein n=1 Tax=Arctium lappa TaxID=4217 RepID=A0ACB9BF37_ARCLA|nr:hypothetical protein L6452_20201 [Arctium lappa]
MERRLNTIYIGVQRLTCYLAKSGKPQDVFSHGQGSGNTCHVSRDNHRDERSFTNVDGAETFVDGIKAQGTFGKHIRTNGSTSNMEGVKGIPNIELEGQVKQFLNNCIIGEVKEFEHLSLVEDLCFTEGIEVLDVKFLGGLDVLMCLKNKETMENITSNPNHGIRNWLKKLKSWDELYRPANRLTWINVFGILIHAWTEKAFGNIVGSWGRIMSMENCSIEATSSFETDRVLILTDKTSPIDIVVPIAINRRIYQRIHSECPSSSDYESDCGDAGMKIPEDVRCHINEAVGSSNSVQKNTNGKNSDPIDLSDDGIAETEFGDHGGTQQECPHCPTPLENVAMNGLGGGGPLVNKLSSPFNKYAPSPSQVDPDKFSAQLNPPDLNGPVFEPN